MPGGALSIVLDDQFQARMTGPVCKVAEGILAEELWQGLAKPHDAQEFSLVGFQPRHAATVLSWISEDAEASAWAGLAEVPRDSAIFEQWHADPGVSAWMLMQNGDPVGYGEVWDGFEADAVELARILIAPAYRGRGIARILIDKLCETLPSKKSQSAYVRVRPHNVRAVRCYQGTRFLRVPAEQEALYNIGQPVEYVWMRRTLDHASKSSDRPQNGSPAIISARLTPERTLTDDFCSLTHRRGGGASPLFRRMLQRRLERDR
jgi:ribosomal protein S18 acetylase RimI-like enzyme